MNDLEQLLKQYGEDQRLQDSLADKLRRKARLQRRWAAIVGCVVLMSAIGLAIWNPEPLPQTEIIVAENSTTNSVAFSMELKQTNSAGLPSLKASN